MTFLPSSSLLLCIIFCRLWTNAFVTQQQSLRAFSAVRISSPFPPNRKPVYTIIQKRISINDDEDSSAVPSKAVEDDNDTPPQRKNRDLPKLTQVDVIYKSRTSLVFDPKKERFLPRSKIRDEFLEIGDEDSKGFRMLFRPIVNSSPVQAGRKVLAYNIKPYLKAVFIPEGVTPAYYRYIRWRIIQRWVNANLQVFGTQSLLLGLGIKSKSLAALSAALNWVLKDALGKVVRMMWAAKMGGRFDSDAKRWRFRASLLYAAGNGLEIATFIFPQLFLLLAATANCCKQMSMLTSSSTRTSLYNSFRDGSRENIGDITAKGEASIACVDLLGIATGVTASQVLGTSVRSVLSVYCGLQTIECFCIYRMMRTINFKVLNFERLVQVLNDFIDSANSESSAQSPTVTSVTTAETATHVPENGAIPPYTQSVPMVKTPVEMGRTEKIIKPPALLSRRAFAFGSLGRARLQPDELLDILDIFQNEKFLLVVGKNVKASGLSQKILAKAEPTLRIQENCHIVLHLEATNEDVVKSALALSLLRRKLAKNLKEGIYDEQSVDDIRTRDCLDLVRESCDKATELFPRLLQQLSDRGWTSPATMFGQVTMRAEWPLLDTK